MSAAQPLRRFRLVAGVLALRKEIEDLKRDMAEIIRSEVAKAKDEILARMAELLQAK